MLDIRVAVAKIGRTSASDSGDTLEFIERPGGGFSFVLVDGEGSGRGAKSLSNLLATRAIALLKDNRSDEDVARAIHDYLYTYRMGQAAATLNILSVDFSRGVVQVTRNNPAPFYTLTSEGMHVYNEPSAPIGLELTTLPLVSHLPVQPYTYIVLFTDGLLHAGERFEEDIDVLNYLAGWPVAEGREPQEITDELLARALEVDHGEPADDISIMTLAILPAYPSQSGTDEEGSSVYPVRRLNVSVPFEQV